MNIPETISKFLIGDIGKLLFILLIVVLFSLIEYYFPAEKGQTIRGKARNLGIIALFLFLGGSLAALVSAYVNVDPQELAYSSVLVSAGVVVLYLFVGDFFFYWYHRAEHAFPFLWSIHELHHSDEELNVTSGFRTFFLERPVQYLIITIPTYYTLSATPLKEVVSLDPVSAMLFPAIFLAWLFFVHTNVRLTLGPFTKVVTGPQLHRLHHSKEEKHLDSNFAQFFPIYDILFGTYVGPERTEFPKTGTRSLHTNVTLGEILFKPFRDWSRMVRKPH